MKLLASIFLGLGIFVGIMVVLMLVPTVLARVLDPIHTKRIKSFCKAGGCMAVEVKAWPNHYGVTFQKGSQQHHAKCRVVGLSIKWQGKDPASA